MELKHLSLNDWQTRDVILKKNHKFFLKVRENCRFYQRWSDLEDFSIATGNSISAYISLISPLGKINDEILIKSSLNFDVNFSFKIKNIMFNHGDKLDSNDCIKRTKLKKDQFYWCFDLVLIESASN